MAGKVDNQNYPMAIISKQKSQRNCPEYTKLFLNFIMTKKHNQNYPMAIISKQKSQRNCPEYTKLFINFTMTKKHNLSYPLELHRFLCLAWWWQLTCLMREKPWSAPLFSLSHAVWCCSDSCFTLPRCQSAT